MSFTMQHRAEPPHIVGYATFIKVWIALVVLTGLLVGLSLTHRPNLALLGLLVITPTKASLVFFYFMHLKYESAAAQVHGRRGDWRVDHFHWSHLLRLSV